MTTQPNLEPDVEPSLPPGVPPGTRQELEPPPQAHPMVRWPARVVAIVVVLPFRLVWDVCGAIGRGVERLWNRWVLRPWEALCRFLFRWTFRPLGRLLLRPLGWLVRFVLDPFADAVAWVWRHLVVTPARLLWRHLVAPIHRAVLRPVGQAFLWAADVLGRALSATWRTATAPVRWLHRHLLAPAGRAVSGAWRWATAPIREAVREMRAQLARNTGRRE